MANLAGRITKFQEFIYEACRKIPRGRVSTYREIARAVKNARASRAVGNALNKNPFAPAVPCHRVVRSDGHVGGFASGRNKKILMLKKEGIKIKDGKIANLDDYLFRF